MTEPGASGAVKEQKAVLVLPDLGLSEAQIDTLKQQFHNSVIESMGGAQALAARRIIIVVVVVVIERPQRPPREDK